MSRRPRVALVCGTYARDRDGVADYTGMLAAALPAVGVDPTVVSAAGADPGALPVTPGWDARGALAAARALRRLAPDVVHVQFAPSAYGFSAAVGILPALVRAPVVATLHEYGWWSWPARVPPGAWRPLERAGVWDRETALLGPRGAALVVTNPGHAAAVHDRLRRDPLVVPIGPNVVPPAGTTGGDGSVTRAEVRAGLGLPAGAPLLVFFGFVHPVKGVRYALEALAELTRDDPGTHLAVAGGFASLALPGEEAASFRRELEKHATDVGVAEAVTFTGHLPAAEVSRLLAAADAVVLPLTAGVTTKSGALLAAWAHGAPVVATVADEPDPALADGETAVLVGARRDGPALARGVRRLLADPSLAARVGAGGAAFAAGRSWDRVADAHAALYREVVRW